MTAKHVRPLKGKLLGEILDGETVSPGGIIMVGSLKRNPKPRKVRIIAIGGPFEDPKTGKSQEYRAKPGQVAFFKLAEGQKVEINRKRCLILENKDIVAVEI